MSTTEQLIAERLSAAQRRVLTHLERTAFYGQNQRTFEALSRQGLIEYKPPAERQQSDANMYRRTEFGAAVLRRVRR